MQRITLDIDVDDKTAQAFRNAPRKLRERILDRARRSVTHSLMTPEEVVREFDGITAKAGAQAKARGWTEEMDAALLRGDFDHE